MQLQKIISAEHFRKTFGIFVISLLLKQEVFLYDKNSSTEI